MFTSFPRRVTPTLPEVKAKFFSKNSPKNSTEKANLITLLHYMFQLLNCRAPIGSPYSINRLAFCLGILLNKIY